MFAERPIDKYTLSQLDLPEPKIGCDECDGKGYMLVDNPYGQALVKRCKCFKEFLAAKRKKEREKKREGRK